MEHIKLSRKTTFTRLKMMWGIKKQCLHSRKWQYVFTRTKKTCMCRHVPIYTKRKSYTPTLVDPWLDQVNLIFKSLDLLTDSGWPVDWSMCWLLNMGSGDSLTWVIGFSQLDYNRRVIKNPNHSSLLSLSNSPALVDEWPNNHGVNDR